MPIMFVQVDVVLAAYCSGDGDVDGEVCTAQD